MFPTNYLSSAKKVVSETTNLFKLCFDETSLPVLVYCASISSGLFSRALFSSLWWHFRLVVIQQHRAVKTVMQFST